MAALTWNNAGERFFETGVDRGVLFVGENPGVPWNGLVGVSEAPTGGEPTPYYNDGLKYINLATSEEYAATIDALSSPPEFDECDGTGTLGNGLFVTQQIRKQFHLSYRTRVGNDIDGTDHGYKIHLVYNALAGPSARPYTTLSDSTEAMTLSWGITTIPAIAAGFKPTAHYVIDSRKTPKVLLRYFESLLYGDEATIPMMPSAQEVTTLFTVPGPVAVRNLHPSPRGDSNASYYPTTSGGFTGASTSGDVTTQTYDVDIFDTPIPSITTRVSRTTSSSTSISTAHFNYIYACTRLNPDGVGGVLPPGTRATFGYLCWTNWSNPGATANLRVTPHTRVGGSFGSWGSNGQMIDLGDGWYWGTTTILCNGTTDTYFGSVFGSQFSDNALQTFPYTFSITGIIALVGMNGTIPTSLSMEDYFDGDYDDSPNRVYDWEGVPHKSPSLLKSWGD